MVIIWTRASEISATTLIKDLGIYFPRHLYERNQEIQLGNASDRVSIITRPRYKPISSNYRITFSTAKLEKGINHGKPPPYLIDQTDMTVQFKFKLTIGFGTNECLAN